MARTVVAVAVGLQAIPQRLLALAEQVLPGRGIMVVQDFNGLLTMPLGAVAGLVR